jgi:hypothetical protein
MSPSRLFWSGPEATLVLDNESYASEVPFEAIPVATASVRADLNVDGEMIGFSELKKDS